MKKTILKLSLAGAIFAILLSGCASFQETYKPLYQVKPLIEEVKE